MADIISQIQERENERIETEALNEMIQDNKEDPFNQFYALNEQFQTVFQKPVYIDDLIKSMNNARTLGKKIITHKMLKKGKTEKTSEIDRVFEEDPFFKDFDRRKRRSIFGYRDQSVGRIAKPRKISNNGKNSLVRKKITLFQCFKICVLLWNSTRASSF